MSINFRSRRLLEILQYLYAFCLLSTIMLAVNNDDVKIDMRYDWFFLVGYLSLFFLQSADSYNDQQESRAVAGKPLVRCCCKIRYVSKFAAA